MGDDRRGPPVIRAGWLLGAADCSACGWAVRGAGPDAGEACAGPHAELGPESHVSFPSSNLSPFIITAKSIIQTLGSYLYGQAANMYTPYKEVF